MAEQAPVRGPKAAGSRIKPKKFLGATGLMGSTPLEGRAAESGGALWAMSGLVIVASPGPGHLNFPGEVTKDTGLWKWALE